MADDDGHRPTEVPPRDTVVQPWIVACAAIFVCAWGGNQFTPLLTMYRQSNGYSTAVVDTLLAAYVLGLAPALITGHLLAERFGRVRTVLGALFAGTLGSTALAVGGLACLSLGRMLSGVAVGLGMAVGTGWVVKLTISGGGAPGLGARRAALSLTAGFGVGAGVAGVLATLAPGRETTPYLPHILVTIAVIAMVLVCCERDPRERAPAVWVNPLRVPSLRHVRFRRLVLPLAPWIFGAAGVAYAVLPETMAHTVGRWSLLYATALTVVTLGVGAAIQPAARHLDHAHHPRAILAAMAVVTIGVAAAALSVEAQSPWLGVGAAVLLGLAFGMALVAGLLELQRLSAPDDLAAMTGFYYSLAYLGFCLPAVLAFAGSWFPMDAELGFVAVVAIVCTAFMARWSRSVDAQAAVANVSVLGPVPKGSSAWRRLFEGHQIDG